jgi:putative GTP pyrophosphokinase
MRERTTGLDQEKLLEEYSSKRILYADFASTLATLLTQMISERDVQIHSVTSRAKEPNSIANKLQRPERSYVDLTDLTDLAGVRVTTYFLDHIEMISDLIENEFTVDWDNSSDKRTLMDPDRFGYVSLHYVVEFSPSRTDLLEYQRFLGLKAEIQIRSLLQHVWAEIEHDLGYKSNQSVPRPIRRRFARLAGMLELADDEFVAIRDGDIVKSGV